jgi:hypothetical protein
MIRFRAPGNLILVAILAVATAAGYLLIASGTNLPVRWGFDLQPTATLQRDLALLQMPIATVVIWGLFLAVERFGNADRRPSQIATLNWTLTGVTALLAAVQIAIVVIGMGIRPAG